MVNLSAARLYVTASQAYIGLGIALQSAGSPLFSAVDFALCRFQLKSLEKNVQLPPFGFCDAHEDLEDRCFVVFSKISMHFRSILVALPP